jgi:hypothetical protein
LQKYFILFVSNHLLNLLFLKPDSPSDVLIFRLRIMCAAGNPVALRFVTTLTAAVSVGETDSAVLTGFGSGGVSRHVVANSAISSLKIFENT